MFDSFLDTVTDQPLETKYPIMKYFQYSHLPDRLQEISQPFCELAKSIAMKLPDGAEKSTALRKLLECKDAAVRAAL